MAHRNMAMVNTSTSGTGTVTLGTAVSGFLTFADAGVKDGERVTYVLEEGANREMGEGIYTASGTTLTRERVLASTNSGAKISLSGAAKVFIALSAQDVSPTTDREGPLIIEDWHSNSTSSGQMGSMNWGYTNGSRSSMESEQNHPGIFYRYTNASTQAYTYLGAVVRKFGRYDEIAEMCFIWRWHETPGSTHNVRFGFSNAVNSATKADGAYFERLGADTSLYAVVKDASAETRVSVLADTSAWMNCKIRRESDTRWVFTVNDVETVFDSDPNLPTASNVCYFEFTVWNTSGTALQGIDVDFTSLRWQPLDR